MLFDRIVDDAAMFPPGNATAVEALTGHLRLRSSQLNPYVGPLLVHERRWDEVVAAYADLGSPQLEVVVIGSHRLPGGAPRSLRVVGFEQPVGSPPIPATDDGLPLACELTADDAGFAMLAEVADAAAEGVRVIGKFRTGGTEAAAFPDERTVGAVVAEAVKVGASVKFTAGLHHAVRHTDESGFEHHGLLNLLAAVARADAGVGIDELVDVLSLRDGGVLADTVRGWRPEEVRAVRRTFVSFGCCGVEEPLRDLARLGLIDELNSSRHAEVTSA